jgi:hypothetical protein
MSQGILRVLQPEGWAPAKGYANGVAARGEMIFVVGGTGNVSLKPTTLWRNANKPCKTLWPRWLAQALAQNTWPE